MERRPKGDETMGLFTNRKREDDDAEVVQAGEAIDALDPAWIDDEAEEAQNAAIWPAPTDVPAPPNTDVIPEVAAPFIDEVRPDVAAPFVDPNSVNGTDEHEAARALAEFGITLEETEPTMPPGPRRPLADQPTGMAHAGNVEIDAHGLLEMLGVEPDAALIDISDARLRFLAEHDPAAEGDADAAAIKERIRRQVNVAYASFRLTHAD